MRLLTAWGQGEGLAVQARIPGRCEAELVAQEGLGTRLVPWAELDSRAGELPGLVDEVWAPAWRKAICARCWRCSA